MSESVPLALRGDQGHGRKEMVDVSPGVRVLLEILSWKLLWSMY
jgi:hypothetical protein